MLQGYRKSCSKHRFRTYKIHNDILETMKSHSKTVRADGHGEKPSFGEFSDLISSFHRGLARLKISITRLSESGSGHDLSSTTFSSSEVFLP